jgi:hypothetical protein
VSENALKFHISPDNLNIGFADTSACYLYQRLIVPLTGDRIVCEVMKPSPFIKKKGAHTKIASSIVSRSAGYHEIRIYALRGKGGIRN